jgi:hypothetical protein
MKKYFVICRETCSVCGGQGVTCPHALFYTAYYEFIKSLSDGIILTREECLEKQDQWIRDKGYDPNNLPPEEVECHQCRGNGFVESRVPLEEAISELMSKSDNQLIGR